MKFQLPVLIASLITFAATNIDDALLLTLFFARRIPPRRIVAGQYLGFLAIIIMSLVGMLAALSIPHRWSRVIGLLPLALGVKQLFLAWLGKERDPKVSSPGLLSIVGVTLSNGADNVGVYVPFFLLNQAEIWLILATYGLLVGVWCFAGQWLGNHPMVLDAVDRWGHWLMPAVFIGLGIYILA
jgi:cadmium resistance protein CadD (predicted permease)